MCSRSSYIVGTRGAATPAAFGRPAAFEASSLPGTLCLQCIHLFKQHRLQVAGTAS